MRKARFHISPYIIVPLIFTGIASFTGVVGFRIAENYLRKEIDSLSIPLMLALIIGVAVFFCGLFLVRLLLNPVERFVKNAEKLSVLSTREAPAGEKEPGDRLEHFNHLFNQVTDVLTMVEARKLFPNIIGESMVIRGVFSQIMKVAPTDSTVLITGESGTGKELVATSIHRHSLRKNKPFIKLNCVAIPETLLESELFGYEKGAFTGANGKKVGKFEMANRGTLFLDEIGDMPLNTQAKILRVIQEREFDRIGGTKTLTVDVRFIVATNKNLEKMVEEGLFREDLYYRLNVFSIHLPCLKERREDVSLLVDQFLKNAFHPTKISAEALESLSNYSWPGNVRELQNIIERAAVMCENGTIEAHHLPLNIIQGTNGIVEQPVKGALSLDDQLQKIEKRLIIESLRSTGGFQVKAAELLGINQRSLWHRIKKHNIDVKLLKNNTL